MTDTPIEMLKPLDRADEQRLRTFEQIFAAARPGAVFGEPVVSGAYTVITASEVGAGGGFGSGGGFGPTPSKASQDTPAAQLSGGSGMGGGGGSSGRPVAVITIGPDGVTIRPVVDLTKLGLAALTAAGAMLALLLRMRKASRF